MPATTDYWVNDAEGEPLFVVTTEANEGLVKMLPAVLDEVRPLVGDRRVTVVFDRGGNADCLLGRSRGRGRSSAMAEGAHDGLPMADRFLTR